MDVSGHDVHQTLEYRTATAIVRLLPTGLLLIFLGLSIFALVNPDREKGTFIGIVLCLVFGCGLIGTALWSRLSPGKPLFALSPQGIHYRVPWVKALLIPWREVRGVDTVDVEAGYWSLPYSYSGLSLPRYDTAIFRNVTVFTVSKQFYDSRIFVRSFLLRGPGWNANFTPKDTLVQVALHHELVSVEPLSLREAVEARWLAFRDQPVPTRTSVPRVPAAGSNADAPDNAVARVAPKSDVVAMGVSPRAMSRWEAAKIIVPLIGIAVVLANLAGLWELPGQDKVREARAKVREEGRYWEESAKRRKEETRKREAEEKERQRDFDETMRRAFGR